MKVKISTLCIYVLSIFLLAWALPQSYSTLFEKQVAKTHIFFSPTLKKMVYTEQLLIDDMEAAKKSENHHADVAYKDEEGNYFDRVGFEAAIPFIYFRNMEMRGLLPMDIDGQSYSRADIEKARRVLELPSRRLENKRRVDQIYPLVESNPNQVALVLPTDRFRMTKDAMVFVNSDENAVDPNLTALFTDALKEQDFAFPALGVWGNFTIFKPYDAGVFITDAKGKTFHVLRKNDAPLVTKVPFKEGIVPAKIIISETRDKKLFGLLLDSNNQIYLFHTNNYALTHIPSPDYNPQTMDYKILLDPLYLTAIYSDDKKVHAVAYAYDTERVVESLEPIHSFTHKMSRNQRPFYAHIASVLFPFRINLEAEDNSLGVLDIEKSPYALSYSLLFACILALFYTLFAKRSGHSFSISQSLSLLVFGLYALIPLFFMEQYRKRG